MLRVYPLFVLAFGFLCLTAFRAEEPKSHGPASNTAFQRPYSDDTIPALRVLMLDYSTYDSAYADKMKRLVAAQLSASSTISEFWEGSAYDLNSALATHDVVMVSYPSGGNQEKNKTYGKLLEQYVRQGGVVIFTGTDDYQILQQFGLFGVNFGYFCQDPVIHEISPEHPILEGTTSQFNLSDYAYPLDIADPDFVTLVDVWGYEDENTPTHCWSGSDEIAPAELRNFPVIGFKNLGAGKVIYLGMEYYYDQTEPTRILANTLRWVAQPTKIASTTAKEVNFDRPVKRSEEVLRAGSGLPKPEIFDLKIYPNPYYEKATLDIELKKSTTVAVEMTNEKGQIVAVVLPQKSLSAGFYRLELPNLPAGVYFVQCKTGEKTSVRQVVKTATR